ncbi:hypothetical protein HanIR_Chr01g0029021 [Helianthus annuus]|nr:hypothetical protein HanIR_Chr01g0029021 [Helianthus annuus]
MKLMKLRTRPRKQAVKINDRHRWDPCIIGCRAVIMVHIPRWDLGARPLSKFLNTWYN